MAKFSILDEKTKFTILDEIWFLDEKCQPIAEKIVKFFHIHWHYNNAFTVGLTDRVPIGM